MKRGHTNTAYRAALAKHGQMPAGPSRSIRTYFIQGRTTGLIKIGKTHSHVSERLRELQAHSPDVLSVIKWVKADIEDACHFQFRNHRAHGEWFRPCPQLMRFISLL